MSTAVVLLNFGEPEHATSDEVVPYLERIFGLTSDLEASSDAATRARRLAEARAPGLLEEYRLIGGSPLHAQARDQAAALAAELERRGSDAAVLLGMQFTPPFIDEAAAAAIEQGATRVIGVPVYPLCGPTTSVAALADLRAAVARRRADVPVLEIAGFHRDPAYIALRARGILDTAERAGLSLDHPTVRLVFSAHGTPMRYVHAGSRYVAYVEELCAAVAAACGVGRWALGYQNHTNRPVEWTQPDIAEVVAAVDARAIVIDPLSFLHEQSETLAELDHELKDQAHGRGLDYARVPVPWDAPELITLLADLVLAVAAEPVPRLRACACIGRPGAFCAAGPGLRGAAGTG